MMRQFVVFFVLHLALLQYVASLTKGPRKIQSFFTRVRSLVPLKRDHGKGFTRNKDEIDNNIQTMFDQNKAWKKAKDAEDPDFFNNLGSKHEPRYMWIGCADARVPAEVITGEDAGSIFVVRNVANLVVNTDFNLMSALQYAVKELKVPHIVVCGHYNCGGIRAAMEQRDHSSPLENWLRNIRDVYRIHRKELDAIKDPEKRHRRLVELNVVEQCLGLYKTGKIQKARMANYMAGNPKHGYTTPCIHGCVFDPATGELKSLNINFRKYINELHEVYDLYGEDSEEIAAEVAAAALQD
mmetsp:Transcript_42087/g.62315  ORF Transcript_42087/g.62315 Transcript_42087/m.62315 type:complete len:297 (-) Transcript_42087:559-1449(-)